MNYCLEYAKSEFPVITFRPGKGFSWSAEGVVVTYPEMAENNTSFVHGLFHEISHAVLEHRTFRHDIDLLKKERDAWMLAKELIRKFGESIDQDHIEDCLDTYRDWIYARAQCPECRLVGLQQSRKHYGCPHCLITWEVPSSRLCAVKRTVVA